MPFFGGGGGGASVDLASPPAIGNTTPNTGAFTTLSASTSLLVGTSGFIFGGTNLLENRNGTSAQTFRIYNTFTDASNYERGFFRWNTNVLEIGAEAAGTGTNRTVRISTYDTIDFRNTQYNYSMGSVAGGLWTFNNGPQILNVCRMDSNYGFQAASTRTFGWVSSTNTAVAPDTALYRNAAGVVEVNNGTAGTFRDLIVRNFRMSAPTGVPTANNSTGTEGSIRWDADYIYICTATNTWKRVAIATWP